ncbi:trypsin-like peptidase domain-containing protein [Candidatus Parcubacteria bacterium]|nr:trypsin-like peptidase domain-containing protein [Candidatus Parcubacteria bacterium]
MNRKIFPFISAVVLLVVLLGTVTFAQSYSDIRKLSVANAESNQALLQKITTLQDQLIGLKNKVEVLSGQNTQVAASLKEVQNKKDPTPQKSQDELVTGAVAKVAPSVVSIVISKDVPKLEVVYQDPFGGSFGDSGIRIPVYRQKGVERQQVGAGTGFIISTKGYILTNKHVAGDDSASYTALLSDGSQIPAKVVYKDPVQDIAILKIDGAGLKSVTLGNSSSLQLGQSVVAIGNALGQYNNSVSIGIISGLNRSILASDSNGTNSEQLKNVIQTDAAINPGNSGGPLVNTNGEVVGVNVATVVGSNNISFSIPINIAKSIIDKVLR